MEIEHKKRRDKAAQIQAEIEMMQGLENKMLKNDEKVKIDDFYVGNEAKKVNQVNLDVENNSSSGSDSKS